MTVPLIDPLPPAPSRNDDPENFTVKADALLAALVGFVSDANTQATFTDGRATAADASAVAAAQSVLNAEAQVELAKTAATVATGAVNYQGDWSNVTAYMTGQSVSFMGQLFIAKVNNTNVQPADGPTWLLIQSSNNTFFFQSTGII